MVCSLGFYGDRISFWVVLSQSFWLRVLPGGARLVQPRSILGGGWTCVVSFWPFRNSSGWWWRISSEFLTRTSCCKTTHAHGYYGAWPGWAVSVSVLPLTSPAGLVPSVHWGVMSMGWSVQAGRWGPCFSVPWMESCSPQSFPRGSLIPNGLILGRVDGCWGWALLLDWYSCEQSQRRPSSHGDTAEAAVQAGNTAPSPARSWPVDSQPPECDSNVCCLSSQPGELWQQLRLTKMPCFQGTFV